MTTYVPNLLSRLSSTYEDPNLYLVSKELHALTKIYKLSRMFIVYDLSYLEMVSPKYYKGGVICKLFNISLEDADEFGNILLERLIEINLSVQLLLKYTSHQGVIDLANEIVDYINKTNSSIDIDFINVDDAITILFEYYIAVKDVIHIILGNTIDNFLNYNDLGDTITEFNYKVDISKIIGNGIFIIKNIDIHLDQPISRLVLDVYKKIA